ncbi:MULTISPECIES: hypothetical protein [Kitasatospora]|uniref:Gram-positive cocci surface proteins LPxTG domain-containing protein n=1 Tax=Kitasatospora setae (strain ATCC 33774 / DSM 43861 / JCM 3304 / KCC A-0304 / NBRC 14216 / KM-6054) TaxID=452652 RepID=E4NGA6_KITSK|nr:MULTISPECIES: hypothetical protein [Kitasatospora]BAJ30536.1 hypothetical protein KSE_47560 [Kitasatospora setae KM-6054]
MNSRHLRAATALAAAALALAPALLLAPAAHAADGPAAPAAGDLAAARSATQQSAVLDQLGHFFARKGVPPTQQLGISAADEAKAAAAAVPRLTGDTVPVYTLSADFVAGRPGAKVAEAGFTATAAVAADGQRASVWSAKQNGGWRVVNIASGSDETDYAAAAAADGGTAFREPQLDAWYELKGDRVLPLDEDARRSVGAHGTTVASYQQLVRQRYGDKLPGSGYDASGKAGGFALPETTAPAGSDGPVGAPLVAGAALGLTALAGTAIGLRRRKGRIAY